MYMSLVSAKFNVQGIWEFGDPYGMLGGLVYLYPRHSLEDRMSPNLLFAKKQKILNTEQLQ